MDVQFVKDFVKTDGISHNAAESEESAHSHTGKRPILGIVHLDHIVHPDPTTLEQ
jgi:hypothetical protein